MSLLTMMKDARECGLEGWQLVTYCAMEVALTLIRWGLSSLMGSSVVGLISTYVVGA